MTPAAFGQEANSVAPSNQITLGCIGVGGHGTGWNLDAFLKIPEARVLAVCDVYRDRCENARDMVNEAYGSSDCGTHGDFREVLARPDIDAVVISTPDHWHVLMSVMAARAGKHVFCEKPTLTVEEGQVLIDVIKQTGVVYQGGIEDRSVEIYHRMAELVRNGCIGKLNRILVVLPEGEVFPKEEEAPVPEGFDYDLWLGPAPYTPYTPTKTGQQEWRNVFDYSGGKLTDWGAHLMDTAQVAMFQEHGGPISVDGNGTFPEGAMSNTATEYKIYYEYPGGVEMIVKSGGSGIRFEGTDGWVESPSWRKPMRASDPAILDAVIEPAENKMWPLPPTEHQSFIDGVKGRTTPYYTPTDIHRLSTAMHVGNISMRLGRKLTWDPESETFPGDDEANPFLSRPMREPWSLKETV
ncbi:MAG: dehydrogenase [Candidatus Hydrogenedentota bacterium]